MIIGLGTDIIEVRRVRVLVERYGEGFERRWFSPREIDYCLAKRKPWLHFAARLATKEAAVKALHTPLSWRELSVEIGLSGAPVLLLSGSARQKATNLGVSLMHLSISHCEEYATATVIAERLENLSEASHQDLA